VKNVPRINYADLSHSAAEVDQTIDQFAGHVANTVSHVSAVDRETWDAKVDSVDGKGLSTEDYTTEDKTKLAGLENYDDTAVRTLIAGKQNVLTFDQTPTENSGNPVTSGGVYTSQQAQDSAITVLANAGAKNLLHVTGASASTVTVNSDGTMTVNGTNSGNVSITLGTVTLTAGRYVLSSGVNLPQGVYLSVRVGAGETKHDCTHNVESVVFTVPADMTMDRVWLFIPSGTAISDLVIRPMIRRAEIADDTFIPYAPTNRELYEMILALQNNS
jgi:hypothetical protein